MRWHLDMGPMGAKMGAVVVSITPHGGSARGQKKKTTGDAATVPGAFSSQTTVCHHGMGPRPPVFGAAGRRRRPWVVQERDLANATVTRK